MMRLLRSPELISSARTALSEASNSGLEALYLRLERLELLFRDVASDRVSTTAPELHNLLSSHHTGAGWLGSPRLPSIAGTRPV